MTDPTTSRTPRPSRGRLLPLPRRLLSPEHRLAPFHQGRDALAHIEGALHSLGPPRLHGNRCPRRLEILGVHAFLDGRENEWRATGKTSCQFVAPTVEFLRRK